MPTANFLEYARGIEDILHRIIATGEAVQLPLRLDQRSSARGFLAGSLQFYDGSSLSFREFLDLTQAEPKIMYAYHYQSADQRLIFRYDNAVHRSPLPQAEHKHVPSGVESASRLTLSNILNEILHYTI